MIRIIGGKNKGRKIAAPKNLPVRPTTDFAKEALFNILRNKFDFEEITALDLFCGTGNISYELASRGTKDITCVDIDAGCIHFVKNTIREMEFDAIHASNYDIFKFLRKQTRKWDLIFADPPYDLPQLNMIAAKVLDRNLLQPEGYLIIEHPSLKKLDNHLLFLEQRKYGSSSFSFFGKNAL